MKNQPTSAKSLLVCANRCWRPAFVNVVGRRPAAWARCARWLAVGLGVAIVLSARSAQTERLLWHDVRLDAEGKLISWMEGDAPYDRIIRNAWAAFKSIPVQSKVTGPISRTRRFTVRTIRRTPSSSRLPEAAAWFASNTNARVTSEFVFTNAPVLLRQWEIGLPI